MKGRLEQELDKVQLSRSRMRGERERLGQYTSNTLVVF